MDKQKKDDNFPIYVISGGKGVAGHTMVHSLLIQYPNNKLPVKVIPEINSEKKIKEVVQKVKNAGGVLTHTMVNAEMRHLLINECEKEGVHHIDFMGDLADFLEQKLGLDSVQIPGLYQRVNSRYYRRIEAIEFTMNHDDGLNPHRLKNAEIILTGVSRSGKTPLSVYMSMFGWKVANVPLIKGIEPPLELFEIDPRRVFGLYIKTPYLIAQRYKRLKQMNNLSNEAYIDKRLISEEIKYTRSVFEKGGFTQIDVTNKPIETTANEIIGMVSDRFHYEERNSELPNA